MGPLVIQMSWKGMFRLLENLGDRRRMFSKLLKYLLEYVLQRRNDEGFVNLDFNFLSFVVSFFNIRGRLLLALLWFSLVLFFYFFILPL